MPWAGQAAQDAAPGRARTRSPRSRYPDPCASARPRIVRAVRVARPERPAGAPEPGLAGGPHTVRVTSASQAMVEHVRGAVPEERRGSSRPCHGASVSKGTVTTSWGRTEARLPYGAAVEDALRESDERVVPTLPGVRGSPSWGRPMNASRAARRVAEPTGDMNPRRSPPSRVSWRWRTCVRGRRGSWRRQRPGRRGCSTRRRASCTRRRTTRTGRAGTLLRSPGPPAPRRTGQFRRPRGRSRERAPG